MGWTRLSAGHTAGYSWGTGYSWWLKKSKWDGEFWIIPLKLKKGRIFWIWWFQKESKAWLQVLTCQLLVHFHNNTGRLARKRHTKPATEKKNYATIVIVCEELMEHFNTSLWLDACNWHVFIHIRHVLLLQLNKIPSVLRRGFWTASSSQGPPGRVGSFLTSYLKGKKRTNASLFVCLQEKFTLIWH